MMSSSQNGKMGVDAILRIMEDNLVDPKYDISPEDARSLVYDTTWPDITEAAKRIWQEGGYERARRVDADLGYTSPDAMQAILAMLPLRTDAVSRLGVSYEEDLKGEESSSLPIKKKIIRRTGELLDGSWEAFFTSNDVDNLHGSHKYAKPDEARQLRINMKDYAAALQGALENGTTIQFFVSAVKDASRTNIENLWRIGIRPHLYQGAETERCKAHLFISVPKGYRESFASSFEASLKQLESHEGGAGKREKILISVEASTGIAVDRLNKLLDGTRKPKVNDVKAIQSYLTRYLSNVNLLPPVHKLGKTVMIFSRRHAQSDIDRQRLVEGVAELRYARYALVETNLPALGDFVEADYRNRDISRPAWMSEWGEPPVVVEDFSGRVDDFIAPVVAESSS